MVLPTNVNDLPRTIPEMAMGTTRPKQKLDKNNPVSILKKLLHARIDAKGGYYGILFQ
ncbi:hypothetical protein XYCOK13_27380 [Xylanibacillus composti]|uniref:Uncharacterized protein n=1 Tax=Xylanibacillus composti TaxID=1572762 RepID=A0A8J4H2Z3_9BACL|nr:hypothetical protein XYCOK13_27380 [Xylanibacillus composti]